MLRSLFQSKVASAQSQALGNVRQASRKKYVKYLLLLSLLIALPYGFAFLPPGNNTNFYIILQSYCLIIGIIHVWMLGKYFEWKNRHSFAEKLEMTLFIIVVSFLITGVVTYFSPLQFFFLLLPTAVLMFIFPLFTISVFDFAMAIPPVEFKKWFYPQKMEIPDMDKIDFINSYVLTFEVYKKDNERLPTFMKFKAPINTITFGELFYMYIFEYNDRNRESQIEFMDISQNRYAWLFYVKPKHWWNSKQMIDPSLTVRENKIRENVVIVPYRV